MIPRKLIRRTVRTCWISGLGTALIAFTPALPAVAEPAAEPDTAAQAEFIEFLEYLGSWNGQEDQWEQFLSDAGETTTPEEMMVDAGSDATSANIP